MTTTDLARIIDDLDDVDESLICMIRIMIDQKKDVCGFWPTSATIQTFLHASDFPPPVPHNSYATQQITS